MRTVAVIGGGASGMMAAVTAASEGARVILLEHKDRIGKKDPFNRKRKVQLHKYPSGTDLLSFRRSAVPMGGRRKV